MCIYIYIYIYTYTHTHTYTNNNFNNLACVRSRISAESMSCVVSASGHEEPTGPMAQWIRHSIVY